MYEEFILEVNGEDQIKAIHNIGSKNQPDLKMHDDSEKMHWDHLVGEDINEIHNQYGTEGYLFIKGKGYICKEIGISGQRYFLFSHDLYLKDVMEKSLDHVAEGVQIFDGQGHLIYANPSSQELEGYSLEEKKGKHLLDIYDLSEDYSTALSVIRTEEPVLNRCDRFITKDGNEVITVNSGYPLFTRDKMVGVCVFESNISLIDGIKSKKFNLESFIKKDFPMTENIRYTFKDIIHTSPVMKQCIKNAKKLSIADANILITGETGTGKELLAHSIHAYGNRRDKPFIDINCSAVPSNLIESLFFGTEKGAFTGSITKTGLFDLAEGGTLFLDEVNSMDIDMQAKLLRVLQEKKYQKVGGHKYHRCDVRIISATNEDVNKLFENGRLRKDFYYRVAGVTLQVPSLKERKEDILPLAEHFLNQKGMQAGKKLQVSSEVQEVFISYQWPGNIREMENIINYSLFQLEEEERHLRKNHLPEYIIEAGVKLHKEEEPKETEDVRAEKTLNEQLEMHAESIIRDTLLKTHGNVTQASKLLGISRQNLQYRVRKHKL